MKHFILLIFACAAWSLAGCTDSMPGVAKAEAKESSEKHAQDDEKEEHEEGREGGPIVLSSQQIKIAGIELATAGAVPIRETLPLYGVIVPNAERVRDVSARYPGTLREVNVKVGDVVQQGAALATIESNESLQVYTVKAPLNGVVSARHVNPSEQTGDKVLFTVADLSTVWVDLSLFPRDAGQVHVDQRVRVTSTDNNTTGEGAIVFVSPFGTSSSQTMTARVILDNPQRRWTPGLFVSADVILSETQVPIAIRNEAVQTVEGRSVVFVKESAGFEPRPVRLGRHDSSYSEVVAGLDAGATYVTTNSFMLKAELSKGEVEDDD